MHSLRLQRHFVAQSFCPWERYGIQRRPERGFHRCVLWAVLNTLRRCARRDFLLGILLPAFGVLWVSPGAAQDFTVQNTIPVGTLPRSAVLTRDGSKLFVANNGGSEISVIDTATENVSSINVGIAPHGLLLSHDGRRLYALVGNDDPDAALVIIDPESQRIIRRISIPRRTDALALTPDDKRLYIARVYFGVAYLDLTSSDDQTAELQTAIPGLYPIGIAISSDGRKMFVNYQGGGPYSLGPYNLAHDAIVEYTLPNFEVFKSQSSLPNVGDQLALSPDGAELWAKGEDACSRPDYPHEGCPSVPSRVINVLRVSDDRGLTLQPIRTLGLSLVDFNGRISLSPDGEVFIGGGIYLKRVDPRSLETIQRLDIANAGDVAYSPDGQTAYVTVAEKNEVDVLVRGKPANAKLQSDVASLTLSTLNQTLLKQHCSDSDPNKCAAERDAYEVQPRVVEHVLNTRGLAEPDKPPAKLQPGEDYACFISDRLVPDKAQDLEQMVQLKYRKDVEDYLRYTGQESKTADGSQPFHDVTGLLQQPLDQVKKTLTRDSVYLVTMVCANRVTSMLLRKGEDPVFDIAMDHGKPLTQKVLRGYVNQFLTELKDPCSHPTDTAEILFHIVFPPKVLAALQEARQNASDNRLTVMWEPGDQLRLIPMSALYDGHQYLVANYASTVMTKNSDTSNVESGTFTALAAGDSNPKQVNGLPVLGEVQDEITTSFAVAGVETNNDKIPATVLLDDGHLPYELPFSTEKLQSELQKLEHPADNENHRMIVHIASHFVLGDTDKASYLLTYSGPLYLSDISNKKTNGHKDFSFDGVWLVTLSACSTAELTAASTPGAKSSAKDGSEVQSLGYVADANGAHATIASLWDVTDQSTSILMHDLYTQLLQSGQRAESLRQAQLSLLNSKSEFQLLRNDANHSVACTFSYSHPKFWAPFILIGDWH